MIADGLDADEKFLSDLPVYLAAADEAQDFDCAPRFWASRANYWASVVLPMPGSPASITICPRPARASSKVAVSPANSGRRPMSSDLRGVLFVEIVHRFILFGT